MATMNIMTALNQPINQPASRIAPPIEEIDSMPDFFGVHFGIGDKVLYSHNNEIRIGYVKIMSNHYIEIQSEIGVMVWRNPVNVICFDKTRDALKEKYPENFI